MLKIVPKTFLTGELAIPKTLSLNFVPLYTEPPIKKLFTAIYRVSPI
ncbi:MAG: hypothetical protein K9K78_03050 [Spirochaetales bacterium]|nr:hypothetical protein [Spirochaetales bacterium]